MLEESTQWIEFSRDEDTATRAEGATFDPKDKPKEETKDQLEEEPKGETKEEPKPNPLMQLAALTGVKLPEDK